MKWLCLFYGKLDPIAGFEFADKALAGLAGIVSASLVFRFRPIRFFMRGFICWMGIVLGVDCGMLFGAPDSPIDLTDYPLRSELPDPLVFESGEAVNTTEQWTERKMEMKSILADYAVGHMPPPPGNVAGEILKEEPLLEGRVNWQLVRLSFGENRALGFDVSLFVPSSVDESLPVIVFPSFKATPGATLLETMPRLKQQGKGLDAFSLPLGVPSPEEGVVSNLKAVEPEVFAQSIAFVLESGYAVVTYHYQDTGEDTIARNPDGSWAYRNTRFFPIYPDYDWGLLGAWAWGMSRCIDFLETDHRFDPEAIIVTGHSRIGKAVLVAGALDERIAISAPAGSAGGGVGAYRLSGKARQGGEGLDDMMRKYPNWFGSPLHAFRNDPDRVPFDQHWWIALTAPRGFIALEGREDHICSPVAVKASIQAAASTYNLVGAPDSVLGIHYSDHGHAFNEEEWKALMDFSDMLLSR